MIKNSDNFDISMVSLHTTESSDLHSLYILYNVTCYEKNTLDIIGLYKDAGLMIVKSSTKIKVDKLRNEK